MYFNNLTPFGRPLAVLVLCALPAVAQRADLYGRILDTSEGGIGQAAVAVVNEDTGFRRVTQSDPSGNYAVGSLQPGDLQGHRPQGRLPHRDPLRRETCRLRAPRAPISSCPWAASRRPSRSTVPRR